MRLYKYYSIEIHTVMAIMLLFKSIIHHYVKLWDAL